MPFSIDLQGTVIISGGNRGLGFAISKLVAKSGLKLLFYSVVQKMFMTELLTLLKNSTLKLKHTNVMLVMKSV